MRRDFGKEAFAFDYRSIQSFEDACDKLGISKRTPFIPTANGYSQEALEQSEAMYKLLVICYAINDGLMYDENGYTWRPAYCFFNKDGLKAMGEEERKEKHVRFLSAASAANSGFVGYSFVTKGVRCVTTGARCVTAGACYESPLYVNSEEKALYLDEQFRDLLFTFYGIKVKED